MQEKKKIRIVIASVLKPVDDTRMYEKMGVTLRKVGYDVTIAGIAGERSPEGVSTITYPPFPRISMKRLLHGWRVFRDIRNIKPHILIVNTHELLCVAVWVKWISGVAIIYDIRENYYRNILHADAFPRLLRLPLALWVRLKEKLTAPWVNRFILAEENYANELTFLSSVKTTVLENKFVSDWLIRYPLHVSRGHTRLLFTGTLAASTGVFEAVRLADALHALDPDITLTIVGYCAKASTYNKLKEYIRDKTYIHLHGGDRLVPHDTILRAIQDADVGLILYPKNLSSFTSIPTKLYEYMGFHLPVIVSDHPVWTPMVMQATAGVVIRENPDYPALLAQLRTKHFYTTEVAGIEWEGEKLLQMVKQLAY